MERAIDMQVGGNHYKNMPMQPVELFAKTRCTAFQANIWKYITRYKAKNGKQDIEKCIHYAQLAEELKCYGKFNDDQMQLVNVFCLANQVSVIVGDIIVNAGNDNYKEVINLCKRIIDFEFSVWG